MFSSLIISKIIKPNTSQDDEEIQIEKAFQGTGLFSEFYNWHFILYYTTWYFLAEKEKDRTPSHCFFKTVDKSFSIKRVLFQGKNFHQCEKISVRKF